MKPLINLIFILALSCFIAQAQSFQSAAKLVDRIEEIGQIQDAQERQAAEDNLWQALVAVEDVPFISVDTAVFLYRGQADQLTWTGDMTGWVMENPDYEGSKAGLSNIWHLTKTYPVDARLDYQIIRNGNEWLLDPANPHQQLSGYGYNSELRMPEWEPSPYITVNEGVPRGSVSENIVLSSMNLGYDLQFRVYTPAGYSTDQVYPVMYVTDGHEYINEEMGAMINVLDNLIHQELIAPVIAVFIDPREPGNLSNNRRAEQYTGNLGFVSFVADELVPYIDQEFATEASVAARGILGTSLGGNNAAFCGGHRPDVFGLIAPQSPAFFEATYNLYENQEQLDQEIIMTTGVIYDTEYQAEQMKAILELKGYDVGYIEVNEGHSWGNWCALLDDILLYFFGEDQGTGLKGQQAIPLKVWPTIVSPGDVVYLQAQNTDRTKVSLYSGLGKLVKKVSVHGRKHLQLRIPSNMPAGMAIIHRTNGRQKHSAKLIVK